MLVLPGELDILQLASAGRREVPADARSEREGTGRARADMGDLYRPCWTRKRPRLRGESDKLPLSDSAL